MHGVIFALDETIGLNAHKQFVQMLFCFGNRKLSVASRMSQLLYKGSVLCFPSYRVSVAMNCLHTCLDHSMSHAVLTFHGLDGFLTVLRRAIGQHCTADVGAIARVHQSQQSRTS